MRLDGCLPRSKTTVVGSRSRAVGHGSKAAFRVHLGRGGVDLDNRYEPPWSKCECDTR